MSLMHYIARRILSTVLLFIALNACVERIDFDVPPAEKLMVVDGFISDGPPPYTVKLSTGFSVGIDSANTPVAKATITLFDDQGNEEVLIEKEPGLYQTTGTITGTQGHSYFIKIETADGKLFESEPELLHPVGEVTDIRIEYDKRTVVEAYGEVAADVFNVYLDADAGAEAGKETYLRWRMTGTYKAVTSPELHMVEIPPYTPFKNPWPCSGYILLGGPGGGLLSQVSDCTCCTCWIKNFEAAPQLSNTQLVSGNKFKNVKVGEVPINSSTFYEKYLVEIEQMSLTRNAFEFFRIMKNQKENSSSLFQPPSGEIRGNIKALNSNDRVVGLFWATAIKTKSRFIYRSDVPYPVTPIEFNTLPCYDLYKNASNQKPAGWD